MLLQRDDRAQLVVYKIVAADAWNRASETGRFCGSSDDQRDGYIHLSDAMQVSGTYQKYFLGQNDLLLVAFACATLDPHLKWEVSRGGALFPHYYGALPVGLALWQRPIIMQTDGSVPAFEDLT